MKLEIVKVAKAELSEMDQETILVALQYYAEQYEEYQTEYDNGVRRRDGQRARDLHTKWVGELNAINNGVPF